MAYQETTTTSWGTRIKNSFKGIIGGFLLIVAACSILYWNEGRTVKTRDSINEAQSVYVEMSDVQKIDTQYNGKLVHANGVAQTQDIVKDPFFDVSSNTIKLRRQVEFFQWKENKHTRTEKKLGGSEETITEYTYEKTWSDRPIPSKNFYSAGEHENHVLLQDIDDAYFTAGKVDFGAYRLPEFLIDKISGYTATDANISAETEAKINKGIAQQKGSDEVDTYVHTDASRIYIGENPNIPQIGDMRISFEALPASTEISLIAKINNNTFEPYLARNQYQFSRLAMGNVSAEMMFASAHKENKIIAWVIRVAGILACIAGFKLILTPISVILDVVPMIGNISEMGLGFVSTILGGILSFLVIAIAWMRFRPILSISLIAICIALFVFLRIRNKKVEEEAV